MADKAENPAALRFTGAGSYQRKDDERGEYIPFQEDRATKGALEALELRLKDYRTEIIYYGYLMRVSCNAADSLILKTTDSLIYIRGQQLDRLIHLLKQKRAEFVQEFDASRFIVADASAPIIEEIQVADLFGSNVEYSGNA